MSRAGLHEPPEKVLSTHPGKNYCESCLADVIDLGSPDDRAPVGGILRSVHPKLTDGVCGGEPISADCGPIQSSNARPLSGMRQTEVCQRDPYLVGHGASASSARRRRRTAGHNLLTTSRARPSVRRG